MTISVSHSSAQGDIVSVPFSCQRYCVCVRACVHACVRVCVRACVCMFSLILTEREPSIAAAGGGG